MTTDHLIKFETVNLFEQILEAIQVLRFHLMEIEKVRLLFSI